jgi:hypothetical protein
VKKQVTVLIGGSLLAWAVLAYPARLWWGDAALVYSAVAVALCLVPTAATMLWAGWALRESPEQQLVMLLGGTGVRMGVVLGAGLILTSFVPYFGRQSFWLWLLVFYLITLTLEVVLVVGGRPASDGQ